MRILLLFIVVPLVELFLLLQLADLISGWWTFVLVIATGVVGATLARIEGLFVLQRIERELREGKLPAASLVDGLMVLVAAALLITPGILTDLVGFTLLIPPIRRLYRRAFLAWLRRRVNAGGRFTVHTSFTVPDIESPDGPSPEGGRPNTVVQGYLEPLSDEPSRWDE